MSGVNREGRNAFIQEKAAELDSVEHVPDEQLYEIVTRDGSCMSLFSMAQLPDWSGDDVTDREIAAQICAGCPVRRECLELELRTKLGQAVTAAFMNAPPVNGQPQPSAPAPVSVPAGQQRKSFADYMTVARAAYGPGVTVTPAWVREVTGCSRGLSSRLAATLRDETAVNGPEVAHEHL